MLAAFKRVGLLLAFGLTIVGLACRIRIKSLE